MFVERETGGLGRGTIIAGDGENVSTSRSPRSSGPPGSAPVRPATRRPCASRPRSPRCPARRAGARPEPASSPCWAWPCWWRPGPLALSVTAGGRSAASSRSTDDAYVSAHNTTLAAKVAGYVSSITVEDNARVRAGDVIATIDDGDFRLAANAARDKVATQQATVERIGRQIVAQQASVAQAKAQLVSAQAGETRMQLELDRQKSLAQREFASRQTLEQAQANRDQAVAGVQSAQAAVDAADANVDVLKAQQQEGRQDARGIAHRLGQGRARPVVHGGPRPGRRHHRQPRGADRGFRADRPAAGEPGSAR